MVDIEAYAVRIRPLLDDAKKAYGSRDTVSPQHDASREYTKILVEYCDEDGSLPKLADTLGVSYAGMRRRVNNATLPPVPKVKRVQYSDAEYVTIIEEIRDCQVVGTDCYHDKLLSVKEAGYSFSRIARDMQLSSTYTLYYGSDRARARRMTPKGTP